MLPRLMLRGCIRSDGRNFEPLLLSVFSFRLLLRRSRLACAVAFDLFLLLQSFAEVNRFFNRFLFFLLHRRVAFPRRVRLASFTSTGRRCQRCSSFFSSTGASRVGADAYGVSFYSSERRSQMLCSVFKERASAEAKKAPSHPSPS